MNPKYKPLSTLEVVLDSLICYSIGLSGDILVKIKYKGNCVPDNPTLGDIVNEVENLLCDHIGKIRHPRYARQQARIKQRQKMAKLA